MRKRIAKLQRELQRKKQQQSASELQRQRDTKASVLREELNEARGSRMMHLIADVLPASEDELNQLSKLINTKCLPSGPGGKNISWYACFKNLDTDHSGSINFQEHLEGSGRGQQWTHLGGRVWTLHAPWRVSCRRDGA